MRALLLTVGSRGDVQPFVALALRLRAAGHDAVLAAPAAFSDLAGAYDVPFVPLDLDMSQVGAAVAGRRGLPMVRFCRSMGRRAAGVLPGATTAAGLGADIVVHHPVLPVGQHLAEWLGVPAVLAPPLPALVPTRDFLSAAWPCRAPGIVNRPSYRAARLLHGRMVQTGYRPLAARGPGAAAATWQARSAALLRRHSGHRPALVQRPRRPAAC